jgi:hypothetical protein
MVSICLSRSEEGVTKGVGGGGVRVGTQVAVGRGAGVSVGKSMAVNVGETAGATVEMLATSAADAVGVASIGVSGLHPPSNAPTTARHRISMARFMTKLLVENMKRRDAGSLRRAHGWFKLLEFERKRFRF